jgi:hypothetical protein
MVHLPLKKPFKIQAGYNHSYLVGIEHQKGMLLCIRRWKGIVPDPFKIILKKDRL